MRENEMLDSATNNLNYSIYQEQQKKIITLQEQLIQTTEKLVSTKDDLLNFSEKLLICNNEKSIIIQKYNSLKESILSKNIYNMLSDSEFFEKAKMNFNQVPIDLALMFMWGSLLL
jgi:hypothetical protein